MRRLTRIALVGALSLAALAEPAGAANTLNVRVPNGSDLRMTYYVLSTRFTNASDFVRINRLNPTDINATRTADTTIRTVNLHDTDYGNTGWSGEYQCMSGFSYLGVWVCEDGRVRYNLSSSVAPGGSYDDTEARSLACEEMGHAMGLDHDYGAGGVGSCMSQNWGATDYSSHDREQLNAWY